MRLNICDFVKAGLMMTGLAGCASLTERVPVVAVDSNPRGLVLQATETGNILGVTPFFAQIPRDRTQTLYFRAGTSGATEKYEASCDFRWLTTLAGNSPAMLFAPVGYFLYPGLVGFDLLTGGAYDCPAVIALAPASPINVSRAPVRGPLPQQPCRTILLLPSERRNGTNEGELYSVAAQNIASRKGACDSIVDLDAHSDLLEKLGLLGDRAVNPGILARDKWNLLGHETNATHVVFSSLLETSGKSELSLTLYDLFTFKEQDTTNIILEGPTLDRVKTPWWQPDRSNLLSLIPNALGIGFNNNSVTPEPKPGFKLVNKEGVNSDASFTSLVVTSVVHPHRFATWDVYGEITPEFRFFSFSNELTLESEAEPSLVDSRITTRGATGSLFGKTGLHTAFGLFGVGLGAGLAVTQSKLNTETWGSLRVVPTITPTLFYVSFITRDIFFMFAAASYNTTKPFVVSREWEGTSVNYGSFVFGYQSDFFQRGTKALF